MNAAPADHVARISPTASGPNSPPMPSPMPASALAAVSCAGDSARSGRSAAWIGRVWVTAIVASSDSPYTISGGAPARAADPVAARVPPWIRYHAVRSRFLE